jgi:RNA polymerase sigma factor (sigma-70 family)
MMNDDMALLREYAASHSERAFEQLVTRHLNLVHSAALRRVGDVHLAEEISQAVFIILARKAGVLGHKTILSGWLYRATGYVAADALKSRRRRQHREQEACMQSLLNEKQSDDTWQQIAPLLEAAMDSLYERDRNALVLRFFQGKTLGEVGMALGTSEDTAKKRINRALDKLRKFFANRGVASTTDIIGKSISAYSIQAAPAVLAKSVTALALAKGAGAGLSTLSLAKGALKLTSWVKIAFLAGTATIATVGTTSFFVSWLESKNDTIDDKIARVSLPGTTLKDMIRVMGEPKRYWYGGKTLNKKKLPDSFLISYPGGIQAALWRGKVYEVECVAPGPGFSYRNKLRIGSTLDEVVSELGPPTETIAGHTAKDFAEFRLSGFGGVLYTDIGGQEGHCYYWRPDQEIRFMFRKNVVWEIALDVPNFWPPTKP